MEFLCFGRRNISLFLLFWHLMSFQDAVFANSLPVNHKKNEERNPFFCSMPKISLEDLSLHDELQVFAHPPRPREKEAFTLVFVKNNKRLTAHLKDRVYLSQSEGRLEDSSKETELVLELNERKESKLICSLFISIAKPFQTSIQAPHSLEVILPILEKKPDSLSNLSSDHPIAVLSKSQALFPDRLLATLKEDLKKKYRILFEKESGFTTISFSEGDYLAYQNHEWKNINIEEGIENKPLAYVKKISDQEIQLECWDEGSIQHYVFNLKIFVPLPLNENFQQLFSSIRLKTKYQVALQTPKQSLFLRIGDGIILNPNSYETIKNFQLNERCLRRIEGKPFLLFNRIEQKKRQKFFMASFFDATRSSLTNVNLPIFFSGSFQDGFQSQEPQLLLKSSQELRK